MSTVSTFARSDYQHELGLARLALAVHSEDVELRSLAYNAGYVVMDVRREASGFLAVAFDGANGHIVISFRGADDARDWQGPALALVADGDLIKELGIPLRGETPNRQAVSIQMSVIDSWNSQFDEALTYVEQIQQRFPGRPIEVTGHGLGGSFAQIASYTFGLDGRAFDPAGAQNIIESEDYDLWCEQHGITRNDAAIAAGLPMHQPDFINYLVNDSWVSEKTGPQVAGAVNAPLSALAGREGVGEHVAYGLGKAGAELSDLLDALPPIPMPAVKAVAGAQWATQLTRVIGGGRISDLGDQLSERHDMARIVRVFEHAASTGELQQWGQQLPADDEPRRVANTSTEPQRDPDPTSPSHPDHARYQQVREGVRQLDASRGRDWDESSERLSAALLLASKQDPLVRRIDEVVLSHATEHHPAGRLAFAVYRPHGALSPCFHAHVEVERALQTSTQDSFLQLDALTQSQPQASLLAQQHDQQQERERGQARSL